jgi:hypothetical protein
MVRRRCQGFQAIVCILKAFECPCTYPTNAPVLSQASRHYLFFETQKPHQRRKEETATMAIENGCCCLSIFQRNGAHFFEAPLRLVVKRTPLMMENVDNGRGLGAT